MPQVRWQRLNINDERQHVKPPGGASSSRHDHFGTNHSQLMGPDQAVMVGPRGAVATTATAASELLPSSSNQAKSPGSPPPGIAIAR